MRAPGVLLFLILFSTSAFPGDGLLKQQIGGSVRAAVSSHGQTFIAQGSTLVTLSWNSNRIPTVSEISRPFDGWLKHLHVDGDTLWAAAASEHERGHIYEFSLSEDRAPRFEKEWLITDGTMPNFGVLASVGDLIYVGGYNGLITGYQTTTSGLQQVFQLEPETPTLNSSPWVFRGFEYWEDGLLMAVIQMGSRHRAVGGFLAMHMFDVSVPEAPYVISQITGFGDRGYARQGRKIAALTTAGFTFYDWSDPHDPRLDTTHLVAHSSLLGGFFKNDHFALFGLGRGVDLYKLSDELELDRAAIIDVPELSGQFLSERYANSPYPDLLLFTSRSAELVAIDFSDIENPRVHHMLNLPPGEEILSVSDSGSSILAISRYGLFSVSDNLESQWTFSRPHNASRFTDLVSGDGWALAGRWLSDGLGITFGSDEGVFTVDNVAANINRLWNDGNDLWLLIDGQTPSLEMYEFADSYSPVLVLGYQIPDNDAGAVRRRGDYLYLANGHRGIGVARISAGNTVESIGYVEGCIALELDVYGDLLGAVCEGSGISIYDISEPEKPVFVNAIGSGGSLRSVLIDGELLWFTTYRNVSLYDISDLAKPLKISELRHGSIVSAEPYWGGPFLWPERTARLTRSGRGGVWLANGAEGITELSGVSTVSASHTGLWHDPAQPGQGLSLEVLSDEQALVTWYEYDARGHQDWFQGVGTIHDHRVEIEDVYRAHGGAFADPDSSISLELIGSARLAFHDCDTGIIEMEFDSGTRISQLEPLFKTARIGCRLPGNSIDTWQAGLTGLWHDFSLPGQGLSVASLANGDILLNWYTYDSFGRYAWIQGVGEKIGGDLVFNDLYTTSASRLGVVYDPAFLRVVPWGEAVLRLSCLEGTFIWQSHRQNFRSGSMLLERLTIPLGVDCDPLQEQQEQSDTSETGTGIE